MIVLRDKLFGKFDKLQAERQGISVEQLRQNRVGMQGTGTVHDRINMRSGAAGDTGYANSAISESRRASLDARARGKGYANQNVKTVNKNILQDFKQENKGFPKSANSRVSSELKDAVDYGKAEAARQKGIEQSLRKNNIPSPKPKPAATTTAAPRSAASKKLVVDAGNKLKSAGKPGLGKQVTNLVKANPKTAMAIGAGALLTGGVVAGRKSKE
jgi:hypothetical protein